MAIPGARYVTRDVAPGTHIKAAVCIRDIQPPRTLFEDAPRSPRALNDGRETATVAIAVAVKQLRSNQANGGWSRKPVNRASKQEQEEQKAKDDEHEREHEDDNGGGGGDGDDNHDEDDDEGDDE